MSELTPEQTHDATQYKEYGCRCDVRRAAATEQMRDWKSRLGGHIPAHVHGTSGGYTNYGCRCDACSDANRLRLLHYRRNRKRSEAES